MADKVDLYSSAYGNQAADVLTAVRSETYGTDLGQSSWTTVDEYERFCEWLQIDSTKTVLETASGSGGPALYLAENSAARSRESTSMKKALQPQVKPSPSVVSQTRIFGLPMPAADFHLTMPHLMQRYASTRQIIFPSGFTCSKSGRVC